MLTNPYIIQYIEGIESGEIKACEEQKALVVYVKRVFENDDIYTDDALCEKYLKLQRFFPYDLFLWEKFVFAIHFCTFYTSDNSPRWPELFIFVTRGSGKNGYLAFEDFAAVSPLHGIRNYDVSTYAASEDNAQTSFKAIWDILNGDKERFKSSFSWNREKITNIKTNSIITYKTANYKTKDGAAEGKINLDEVHTHEHTKLYDVAITGLGKKKNARITYTSTQGFNRGATLDMLLERAHGILFNGEADGGFFPFLCMLHSIEDVVNPEKWEECNPSLRYFPELRRSYERELAMYKKNPGLCTSFPVKRCNFLVDPLSSIATTADIIACTSDNIPDISGCEGIVGIDYAMINDMMSACILTKKEGVYYCLVHSWICERSEDYVGIKYDLRTAEQRGEVTIIHTKNSIDAELAVQWLSDEAQRRGVTIIGGGADNYRVSYLTRAFEDILHLPVQPRNSKNSYGRTKGIIYINRPSATEKVYPLIFQGLADHNIQFGPDRTTRWALSNVGKEEKDGVWKLKKIERHYRKTDPVMAMVAAFATAVDIFNGNKGIMPQRIIMPRII